MNGDDIPVGARIARLSSIAVLFESIGGLDLALTAVQRRAGGMLDPGLVAAFAEDTCAGSPTSTQPTCAMLYSPPNRTLT